MLAKLRNLLIACVITTLTVLSLIGSITSTLSWFSYSQKSIFTYHGTSIKTNKQLQVGLVINEEDEDVNDRIIEAVTARGLKVETINSETGEIVNEDIDFRELKASATPGSGASIGYERIAWSNPGEGIDQYQISAYLDELDFATEFLSPVTSRRFATDQEEDIIIYDAPYEYNPDNLEAAPLGKYSRFPLAFRVIDQMHGDNTFVKNRPVWLSAAHAEGATSEGFSVAEGVRVHFKSENTQFILRPSSVDPGYTAVGGLLDYGDDGYYDYEVETNKEILFGDCIGTPTYTYLLEDSENVDINNTGKEEPYIFYGKHQGGVNCIENYDGVDIGKQQYETLKSVKADIDPETSQYTGGRPVCITGDNCIGYTELSIWIEGWDLSVVNAVYALEFSLGLMFEINKI